MSLPIGRLLYKVVSSLSRPIIRHKSQRRCLGKPPGVAQSLEQRMEEVSPKDHLKVDIGLSFTKPDRKSVTNARAEAVLKNRNDSQLELLSRQNKLVLDQGTEREEWMTTIGPLHLKKMADHYGIFEHLYGDAYFIPSVPLKISYDYDNGVVPVYSGNSLKPSMVMSPPTVQFTSDPETLWTLIMTTPDGHFQSTTSEYVHWFVGNIKGGSSMNGETIIDYVQPFPRHGAGYFRYIFILYKQEGPVDYSGLKTICSDLEKRGFCTFEFYKERQDILTPGGLGFFQADWDESVTKFFHNQVGVKEPRYSYDFPPHYYTKQEWFPLKQPFNLYMDRYRDEKQIAKEFILKKLKKTNPFKGPDVPLKYPNAVPLKSGTPSWLKNEIRKERLGWGRVNDF